MPKKLSNAALAVLEGVEIVGREVRITDGQLDRKLYVEVNAALEALGGAWNRKAKAHLFDQDPSDALDQVLVDGEWSDRKRDFDQFFTPAALAKRIVAAADVKGKSVLEPSAGHGALVREALVQGAKRVACVERDPRCCEVLRDVQKMNGGTARMAVIETDFMTWSADSANMFECVVMNPPFSRKQDIDHVTAAFGCVRTGGRLVAIMSTGTMFRSDKKTVAFNNLVHDYGTIEKLPDNSFRESGTNVSTVLVVLDKR